MKDLTWASAVLKSLDTVGFLLVLLGLLDQCLIGVTGPLFYWVYWGYWISVLLGLLDHLLVPLRFLKNQLLTHVFQITPLTTGRTTLVCGSINRWCMMPLLTNTVYSRCYFLDVEVKCHLVCVQVSLYFILRNPINTDCFHELTSLYLASSLNFYD